jgi:hypothetical protein
LTWNYNNACWLPKKKIISRLSRHHGRVWFADRPADCARGFRLSNQERRPHARALIFHSAFALMDRPAPISIAAPWMAKPRKN